MESVSLLDCAGRRRSPATLPGYHRGRAPPNKGLRYPPDPPSVEEIIAVMRAAGDDLERVRLRGRVQLRDAAARGGVRRRFAPHQLRHAHAVEMAHEASRSWSSSVSWDIMRVIVSSDASVAGVCDVGLGGEAQAGGGSESAGVDERGVDEAGAEQES
ncbi:MAG: hypothetical protein JO240_03835, partial [Solirubrobacterales bacterium]|nr:hypothetical protein [Solirubrobacterales bacterium]